MRKRYEIDDIIEMRAQFPEETAYYSREDLVTAYRQYSHIFHRDRWHEDQDFTEFIKWATTAPLKIISESP